VNALDRLIGFFAPQAGLARARARLALGVVRSYEAAKAGRRGARRPLSQRSATAEVSAAGAVLRARSRKLVRDNPYAARAVDVLTANIVGEGIVARPVTGDDTLDRRVADLWARFVDQADAAGQLDFYGLQALAVRSAVESGEVLVRRRGRRADEGFAVPVQLQLVEPDYLDVTRDSLRGARQENLVLDGIEFDRRGRRVAYWLYREHPGDEMAALRPSGRDTVRVSADDVAHLYRVQRPGQIRGVPWMAPAMVRLDDLDEYHEAALVRAKVEACLAAFVTQPEAENGPPLGIPADAEAGQRIESFQPGMVGYLRPGESVEFANPTASAAFEPYTLHTLQAIAVAAGVTYDQLTGDLRQANYSSLRAGKVEFRRLVRQAQWQMVVPMVCAPVWRWFLDAAIASGQLPVGRRIDVEWMPPKFEPIDPLKDFSAELAEIRAGVRTLPQSIRERGYDPAAQLAEIQATNALLDALGLVLTADPRRTNDGGSNANQNLGDGPNAA
jgi:lambda family phage portal protein